MARIVLGNRDGALSLAQSRTVLADLATEWPDVNLVQRTFPGADGSALLAALLDGAAAIAVIPLDALPATLPEGVTLAATTKRLEPRYALIAKTAKRLSDLASGACVGVLNERDRSFLQAGFDGEAMLLTGRIDDDLRRLATDECDALILPSAMLHALERRSRIDAYLEPEAFPPAAGSGALGLLVREDDDMAFEIAYTLQHRPSADRCRAERGFANALAASEAGGALHVGALATVTRDGELTLFGAVVDPSSGTVLQATTSGDAAEAEALGRELAQDVTEQLVKL